MNTPSMRTTLFVAVLVAALTSIASAGPVNCAVTPSASACAPTLTLSYHPSGGGPTTIVPGGSPVYSDGSWLIQFTPQTFPEFLFTGGQLNSAPDPFVGYSLGVINASLASLSFSYDYITPFAGGPYREAQTIFVDALIDTAFSGTSTDTPVGGGGFIQNSYVNGVLIPGFGRGTGCATVGFLCQSGAIGALGPVAYLSAASGTLEVKGSFMLSPNSQYTLSGRTELLEPVPEPGTLMLFGSGLLGLAGLVRRKLVP